MFRPLGGVLGLILLVTACTAIIEHEGGINRVKANTAASTDCIQNGDDSTVCRFNADCCSNLCTTFIQYNSTQLPKCVPNTPNNHQSDSFATRPVIKDFQPTKFEGMQRWRGKVAVVTGAASGIGFSLAKRLCNEGMIVVGADINDEGVKKTADHCPENSYHPFTVDLRNENEIIKLFEFINSTVGRVDVMVNNAGVTRRSSIYSASSESVHTTFGLNLIAPILCSREALNIMFAQNITSGYIMFTNTIHGTRIIELDSGRPDVGMYIYAASKHALKVIREGLRRELRAKGSKIRVGEVSPAATITNIPESYVPRDLQDQEKVKELFSSSSVRKLDSKSPDEVAEAFVYMLAAPERMDITEILIENIRK